MLFALYMLFENVPLPPRLQSLPSPQPLYLCTPFLSGEKCRHRNDGPRSRKLHPTLIRQTRLQLKLRSLFSERERCPALLRHYYSDAHRPSKRFFYSSLVKLANSSYSSSFCPWVLLTAFNLDILSFCSGPPSPILYFDLSVTVPFPNV